MAVSVYLDIVSRYISEALGYISEALEQVEGYLNRYLSARRAPVVFREIGQ